jgi:hypothetical protein
MQRVWSDWALETVDPNVAIFPVTMESTESWQKKVTVNRTKKKTILRGLSPQMNYTDWSTAACRRSKCLILRVEGVAWSAQRIPTAVNLGFLDPSRYFFIQVFPQLSSRGCVDPVTDLLLVRKSSSPGNPTRDLWICSQKLWPLDHRGGLTVNNFYTISVLVAFTISSNFNIELISCDSYIVRLKFLTTI